MRRPWQSMSSARGQVRRIALRAGIDDAAVPAGDEAVGDETQSFGAHESRKVSVSPDAVTVHGGTI